MASSTPKYMYIASRRLAYHDCGSGLTVVMLHGAITDRQEWDYQLPALCAAGYRVICPLRAGFGGSDPHDEFASHRKDAADIAALLNYLEIDQAVMIGHSAGAFVALQLYLGWPQYVRALVSIDSAAFGKLDCKHLGQEGYDAETRALYEQHRDVLAQMGRPWDYPSEANIARLQAKAIFQRTYADSLEQITPRNDPREIAPSPGAFCRVPLLVFTTGRGHIHPNDKRVEELRCRLPAPDARLVTVVKSGHWIHRELPDVFNRELLAFLEDIQ